LFCVADRCHRPERYVVLHLEIFIALGAEHELFSAYLNTVLPSDMCGE
jgi:hypothetical protein